MTSLSDIEMTGNVFNHFIFIENNPLVSTFGKNNILYTSFYILPQPLIFSHVTMLIE